MSLVDAKCTNCGSPLKVDNKQEAAVCEFCGSAFIVEKAINNYNTYNVNLNDFSGANVVINNQADLGALYNNARRSKKNCQYQEALNYYTRILEQDSESWEAYYNTVVLQGFLCPKSEVMNNAGKIVIAMDTVLDMIEKSETDNDRIVVALNDYGSTCLKVADVLHERILTMDNPNIPLTMMKAHLKDIAQVCLYIATIGYMVGDKFDQKFPQLYEQNKQLYAKAWKQGVKFHEDCVNYLPNSSEGRKIINDYKSKIKRVDTNYSTSSTSNTNTNSSEKSGGCYVATAVYGSYDCPQVWTLRRFRDNQLAKTWYGRGFIHTYYAISPIIVKWFGNTEWFKKLWRGKLDRMVQNLNSNGVENTPYNDIEW